MSGLRGLMVWCVCCLVGVSPNVPVMAQYYGGYPAVGGYGSYGYPTYSSGVGLGVYGAHSSWGIGVPGGSYYGIGAYPGGYSSGGYYSGGYVSSPYGVSGGYVPHSHHHHGYSSGYAYGGRMPVYVAPPDFGNDDHDRAWRPHRGSRRVFEQRQWVHVLVRQFVPERHHAVADDWPFTHVCRRWAEAGRGGVASELGASVQLASHSVLTVPGVSSCSDRSQHQVELPQVGTWPTELLVERPRLHNQTGLLANVPERSRLED